MATVAPKAHAVILSIARQTAVRRILMALAVLVSCSALAIGGLWLGLRLCPPATYSTALGTASFQVQGAAHGTVEAFIPLADWGLRAHAFKAPLKLHIEPRVLDRQALTAAASGNERLLQRTAKDLQHDGRRAALHTVPYLLAGAVIAGLVGLAMLTIASRRRRKLVIAIPLGTVVAAALIGAGMFWRVTSTWNSDALSHPTYYARGAELIQLLNAAQKANKAKDFYASKVEGAVRGFAALLSNPSAGAVGDGRRALVVSDLHNNTLVLSSLAVYAQAQTVFFVGDFGNTGDRGEVRSLAVPVARLGTKVVAVSGNHDSHALMLALARRGVIVMSSHGQLLGSGRYGAQSVVVDGLRVAGFEDPLEYGGSTPDDPKRIFSFGQVANGDASLAAARLRLLSWFEALDPRPDVVLIHENGLAQFLAKSLFERGYRRPLTLLTGHDHIQHVNHYGTIDIVDAGTVGASGLYGIGTDYVGIGELHWAPVKPLLDAADLIQVEPVSGGAQAERVVLSTDCAIFGTNCGGAVDYLDPREGPNTAAIGGAEPVSPLSPVPNGHVP